MPDYQKMYYAVCDNSSKALDSLLAGRTDECEAYLRKGLTEAEDIYIQTCEPEPEP